MSDQTQTPDATVDIPSLMVDGNNYPISQLPSDVQELINCYQSWERELNEQKLSVFKTEAAMRAVSAEIQNRVRNMVAAAATDEPAANEETQTTDE